MPLAITPVNATFWLAILVLIAAVGLSIFAARTNAGDNSKQLFAIVGVMLGLFGAGGLGSLFANQAASEAAKKAAPEAAAQVTEERLEEEAKESEGSSTKQGGKKNSSP